MLFVAVLFDWLCLMLAVVVFEALFGVFMLVLVVRWLLLLLVLALLFVLFEAG